MATLCTITGTLRDLTGALLVSTQVTFVRSGVAGQDGSTIVPRQVSAISSGTGVLTVTLYAGNYTATTIGSGSQTVTFSVAVPSTATAVLSDLINAAPTNVTPQAVLDAQTAATAAAAAAAQAAQAALDAAAAAASAAAAGGVSDGDRGDITVSGIGTVWTIDPKAITLAKQADVVTGVIMGRSTGGVGSQEILTPASARGILGVREVLTASRFYYVATTGSNINDGLSSGTPFSTIQYAIDTALAIDNSIFTVTINVADGTYAENIVITGALIGGGAILLIGNLATPTNVIIAPASGDCFSITSVASVNARGLQVAGTAKGFMVGENATLFFDTIDFAGGHTFHMEAFNGGLIKCQGNYSISGGAQRHMSASLGGKFQGYGKTVTLTGSPAFSTAYVFAQIVSGVNWGGFTFTGAATGKRFNIQTNTAVNTGGGGASYFPGDVAGTTINGGIYA